VGLAVLLCVALSAMYFLLSAAGGKPRNRPAGWSDTLSHGVWDDASELWSTSPQLRPLLGLVLHSSSLDEAMAAILSNLLADNTMPVRTLKKLLVSHSAAGELKQLLRADLKAVVDRDAAVDRAIIPLLHFKGFQALQAYRIAHVLWTSHERPMALWLQGRVSQVFQLDIHPAARIGPGLLIDHGTGVVIGETAVVGRACSMLHGVTLGATGKAGGDRHPKVGNGVMLGAGASILGNIRIGDHAKIGCSSVVLKPVPDNATVVGIPARIVGQVQEPSTPRHADFSLDDCEPRFLCMWKSLTELGLAKKGGDGVVTFEQFRELILGCGADEFEATNLFFKMDTNNDGVLTQDEIRAHFTAIVAQCPKLSQRFSNTDQLDEFFKNCCKNRP
jgi:serine O-acetyltransferase